MNRGSLAIGCLALLVALVGCNAPDVPVTGKLAPRSAASVEQITIVGGSADSRRRPVSGEHVIEVLNPFPSDNGPVPQLRGQDLRPGETKLHLYATAAPSGTLVLYDDKGPYGWLGELYGVATVNLASHFGATAHKPVAQYASGELAKYKAVIYIGSTYDQPLPVAFLDDVLATTVPVIWMYDNIWQLANRAPNFFAHYGFNPWMFDTSSITKVTYKKRTLSRDALNASGIMQFSPFDPTKATTLASATRANGTTLPWAIRSRNLTYLGEIPFAYISSDDRYLAFCDLLFDTLAPATPERHRALVRIEDVSPAEDPAVLRALVDLLYRNAVPFSVAVIPLYLDPKGVYNGGVGQKIALHDRPQLVSALKYAVSRGGTLILHGYSHQYGNVNNPYSGVSADDFEFFSAHVDAKDQVIYDGPVPGDSAAYALSRVAAGIKEMQTSGFAAPTVFEYPHYAGSPADSRAIRTRFASAYHRGLYFGGSLGRTPDDLTHSIGQFFPYTVTDIYGFKMKPENLGNFEPLAYNNHPPRLPADLIKTAQNNLVIRDGVASFFFHPYYDLAELAKIVTGVKAAGYTFVGVHSL